MSASGNEPKGNIAEFTVSGLSMAVKRVIESGFEYVRVRGELGRISRPASGHVYLDLKDEKAVLAGVIWRGNAARLKIRPEQGMEVIASGRLTTFPGQSRYQIIIESLEPAGLGALMQMLEKLKAKLAAEGLFANERKRPLPFIPRHIGIVTSPSGAVIRDMMHGFEERFPVHAMVWPVRVQGESCAAEVAAAIRGFNALPEAGPIPRPDLLIVARGGGSLEDLWGFNEEIVARAAAESKIPLISAIGHETDWSIIDLVADARAPTPTKAAEWAVPQYSELTGRLGELSSRLQLAQRRMVEERRARLLAASRGLPRPDGLLDMPRQRLDNISRRLGISLLMMIREKRSRLDRARLPERMLRMKLQRGREMLDGLEARRLRAMKAIIERRRTALDAQARMLASLSHKSVLERGFALVRDEKSGQIMRSARNIPAAALLDIEFADGHIRVRRENSDGSQGNKDKRTTKTKPLHKAKDLDNDQQGSLF